jgi:hypothetical protein
MENPLPEALEAIEKSSGKDKIEKYIAYCEELISMKDQGLLREEQVGYWIVGAGLFTKVDMGSETIERVFSAAADLEIPREMSVTQRMGSWDAKTADYLKRKEWEILLSAIEAVKRIA